MNQTIIETTKLPQAESWDGKIDLPGLLMRLDGNQVTLWRCHPGIALYPATRISPAMEEAIHRYQADLWRIADWWGIKRFIRDAPYVLR